VGLGRSVGKEGKRADGERGAQRRTSDIQVHIEIPKGFIRMRNISVVLLLNLLSDGDIVWRADLFAYAIFSAYIPLAKKRRRAVTSTKRSPDAKYGWGFKSSAPPYTFGSILRRILV
jgi:hypothetical protein